MKIHYIEQEKAELGRKPKSPRLNHNIVSKVGKALYHLDNVKEVSIKVKLKGGTAISFYRNEDEDRLENIKRKYDEDEEDGDE